MAEGCATCVICFSLVPRPRRRRCLVSQFSGSPPLSPRAAQPKLWTELQAGIECLTQLLALLEAMATSGSDVGGSAELHEAAALLQQQLVYNGQVLDAALDALRAYRDGTQSLAFLRAGVHLAYAVMRMLEKWARTTGEGSYVRKRTKPKRKKPRAKARNADEAAVPDADVEEEEERDEEARAQHEDDVIEEMIFTFESFELVSELKASSAAPAGSFSSLRRGPACAPHPRVSRAAAYQTPPPEIRKLGHHPIALDLPWPLQRIYVAR